MMAKRDESALPAIRGILFDNDGTLVDTYQLILTSFRYATQQVLGRIIPDEELMQKVGQPLAVQMWDFTDDEAVHDELLKVYREFNHAHHDEEVTAFSGVAEGLAKLDTAGFKLGVVTSKLHWLAQRGLEVVGVMEHFDCLIGADDCSTSKPDPGPILAGAQALGLVPEACLYVGDSPFDIAAGNGAGCPTVAATWGMFPQDVLAAEHPTYTCGTFDELVALCGA